MTYANIFEALQAGNIGYIQDRLAASDISQTCGGKGIDPLQIAQDVTINSS